MYTMYCNCLHQPKHYNKNNSIVYSYYKHMDWFFNSDYKINQSKDQNNVLNLKLRFWYFKNMVLKSNHILVLFVVIVFLC